MAKIYCMIFLTNVDLEFNSGRFNEAHFSWYGISIYNREWKLSLEHAFRK